MTELLDALSFLIEFCPQGMLAAFSLAFALPVLGLRMALRKSALHALALPPVAALGPIVAGLLAGEAASHPGHPIAHLCAIALVGLAAAGLALAQQRQREGHALAAALFLAATSAAPLLAVELEGTAALRALGQGQILTVSTLGATLVVVSAALANGQLLARGQAGTLAALDPDLARLRGVALGPARFLDAFAPAFAIAISTPITGTEPVLAPLLLPAAIILPLAQNLRRAAPLAVAASVLGTAAAAVGSVICDWPFGPAQVVGVLAISIALACLQRAWPH